MLFVCLGDLSGGRLRYSNSEVTDTDDFVFTVIFDRGDTKVTLIGILRDLKLWVVFVTTYIFQSHTLSAHVDCCDNQEQLRNCCGELDGGTTVRCGEYSGGTRK